ncbi:hypothetical protein FRC03_012132 [Tulasnella sp. 419]|nr:hypothetical protein FRC03_012132 [Tulasnella sp. 419]
MGGQDINQTHFDHVALRYDNLNPLRRRIIEDIGDAVLDEFDFDEDSTVMMDYACGLISQQLAPYCKEILGVDISDNMVAQFNLKVSNQGIPADEMQAIKLEIRGDPDELDGKKFDVIVCAQAYHHFLDIDKVTRNLAVHLKPESGTLIIVDLVRGDDEEANDNEILENHTHSHGEHGVVVHPGGFKEKDMVTALVSANLKQISFRAFTDFKKGGRTVQMFIAKGVRTAG